MDKASAYGAGDCRFESCQGHFGGPHMLAVVLQDLVHLFVCWLLGGAFLMGGALATGWGKLEQHVAYTGLAWWA